MSLCRFIWRGGKSKKVRWSVRRAGGSSCVSVRRGMRRYRRRDEESAADEARDVRGAKVAVASGRELLGDGPHLLHKRLYAVLERRQPRALRERE